MQRARASGRRASSSVILIERLALKELEPLICEELLREIDDQLVMILKQKSMEDWNKSTLYPTWKVKDVFSHILDTSIRKLSEQRDCHKDSTKKGPITSYKELVSFIESLADEWTNTTRRISPKVLLTLFDAIRIELYEFMKSLDPFCDALYSVAWAGEEKSKVWFDNAREYTEHWLHQQQIREALNYKSLDEPKYLKPVLETFLRCLLVTFKNLERPYGTIIKIQTIGSVKQDYYVRKDEFGWKIYIELDCEPNSEIRIDSLLLCRMLSKIAEGKEIKFEIHGDMELGEEIRNATALMA